VPELPEVETIRGQLEPMVSGRQIVESWAFPSGKFTDARTATGAAIEGIRRRGKYLLGDLDDGRELIVHLGMTGQLRVVEAHDPMAGDVDADSFTRAWWRFDDGDRLVFRDVRRFGRIAVVDAGRYDGLPTLAALGPEPFDPSFTAAGLHAALARSSVRIKTQLLGQRVVAGVGNIYADEALWAAKINPSARTLSRPRAAALHAALIEALSAGLRNRGTTLRDYRGADGEAGSNQHALNCYGRAGKPCRRCGAPLRRKVVDARGTTWCPTCQR
jgi:formamidopyrimidine-DNA glycosylase